MHHGRHRHAATQPATRQVAVTASTEPALVEQPASPEMLQQKTQSYTQSLQQLLRSTQEANPPAPEPQATTMPAVAPPAAPPAAQPVLESVPPSPPPAVDVSVGAPPPSPATQPGIAGGSVSSLTQRIDQTAHDQPHDAAAQLDGQLLGFVRAQSVPDEGALAGVAQPDRDVISSIMDGLSNYRDVLRSDPTATTTKKLQPLLDMSDRIRAAADLNVPAIALCSAVRGFGDYEVINADNLPAGQSLRAVVYCQITNFASQLNGQMWEIRLNEKLTLYSEATGKAVWNKAEQTIVDRCRQRRHDCYCVEMIELPPTLPPGKYVLTATLEDQIANKLTQATVGLVIK